MADVAYWDLPELIDAHVECRFLEPGIVKRLHYYPRALEAALHVQSRLHDRVSLEEAAAAAAMNPAAFSRFFAEKIGICFSDLVRALKIDRAVTLLEQRDMTAAELAERLGYSSGCAFSRCFKTIVGCSPTTYKRRHLEAACS